MPPAHADVDLKQLVETKHLSSPPLRTTGGQTTAPAIIKSRKANEQPTKGAKGNESHKVDLGGSPGF